jgi:hypothetical protein
MKNRLRHYFVNLDVVFPVIYFCHSDHEVLLVFISLKPEFPSLAIKAHPRTNIH